MQKPRNSNEAKELLHQLENQETAIGHSIQSHRQTLERITEERQELEEVVARAPQRSSAKMKEEERVRALLDESTKDIGETREQIDRLKARIDLASRFPTEAGHDPDFVWKLSEAESREVNDRLALFSPSGPQSSGFRRFVSNLQLKVTARELVERAEVVAKERAAQRSQLARERSQLLARRRELENAIMVIRLSIDQMNRMDNTEDKIQQLNETRRRTEGLLLETVERLQQLESSRRPR